MPLRGESVGTAYVRVLADGTGFPESLRREFEDSDDAFRKQGIRNSKAYKEGLESGLDDRDLRDAFARGLGLDKAVEDFFNGPNWAKTRQRIDTEFGDVGSRMADDIETEFRRKGSLAGLEQELETFSARVNRDVDRAMQAESRAAQQAREDMVKFERDFRAAMNEADAVSKRVSRDNINNLEGLRRTLENMRKPLLEVSRGLLNIRKASKSSGDQADVDANRFSRLAVTIDHMAASTGRAFGKGSRNDALNFFGAFVEGSVKLLGVLPKLIGNTGEFFSGLKEGEGFIGSISAGFTRMAADAEGSSTALSSFVSSGLTSLPLLAVALVGIVGILGIVSALVSGLTAAVIGLAGAIGFGLLGSVAALLPIVVALGGAVGVAILAFKTMDKQTALALVHGLKPFKDELSSLGDTAREGFLQTFTADVGSLANKMRLLNPLVEAFGEGLGSIADQIATSLSGAGGNSTLHRFLNVFSDFIPGALRQIGHIAGNITGTILAIFSDSIPLAQEFLDWLDKVTGRFQKFITSRPGKVTGFLQDAADSAKDIFDFLGQALHVAGQLLKAGKGTGDTIFTDLADNLRTFGQFLNDHPDALGEFFQNGKQTAEQIGEIAVSLGQLIDALDNPQTRDNLHLLLDTLTAIGKLAPAISAVSGSAGLLGLIGLFNLLKGPAKAVGDAISHVAHALAAVDAVKLPDFSQIKDFFSGSGFGGAGGTNSFTINPAGMLKFIPGVLSRLRGFKADVGRIFNGIPDLIKDPLRGIGGFFGGIANNIFNPFSRLPGRLSGIGGWGGAARGWGQDILGAIQGIPGRIFSIFVPLPGRLGNIGGWATAASTWAAQVLARISDIPGQIVDMFRGLASQIVGAIGTIVPHFSLPNIPGLPHHAAGGIFDKATVGLFGEAGREALVPLDRPLSEVDPSVRWLSALARGMTPVGTSPIPTTSGKTINNEFHIITPTENPAAVAHEVVNQLVASGYN